MDFRFSECDCFLRSHFPCHKLDVADFGLTLPDARGDTENRRTWFYRLKARYEVPDCGMFSGRARDLEFELNGAIVDVLDLYSLRACRTK